MLSAEEASKIGEHCDSFPEELLENVSKLITERAKQGYRTCSISKQCICYGCRNHKPYACKYQKYWSIGEYSLSKIPIMDFMAFLRKSGYIVSNNYSSIMIEW
jgi:hypothetical protein